MHDFERNHQTSSQCFLASDTSKLFVSSRVEVNVLSLFNNLIGYRKPVQLLLCFLVLTVLCQGQFCCMFHQYVPHKIGAFSSRLPVDTYLGEAATMWTRWTTLSVLQIDCCTGEVRRRQKRLKSQGFLLQPLDCLSSLQRKWRIFPLSRISAPLWEPDCRAAWPWLQCQRAACGWKHTHIVAFMWAFKRWWERQSSIHKTDKNDFQGSVKTFSFCHTLHNID